LILFDPMYLPAAHVPVLKCV